MAQLRLQRKNGSSIKQEPNYKLVYYMGNEFVSPTEEELRYAIQTGGWAADNFDVTRGSTGLNGTNGYYAGFKINQSISLNFDKSFVYRNFRGYISRTTTTNYYSLCAGTSHSNSGISNRFIIDSYQLRGIGTNPVSFENKKFVIGSGLNLNSSIFYSSRETMGGEGIRNAKTNTKNSNHLFFDSQVQQEISGDWVDIVNSEVKLYCAGFCRADDISGLSAYGSNIATILSNSQQLFSNSSVLKWMVNNCTGDFMISALSNTTFIAELNNSSNPNTEIVKADEDWAKFIALLSV